MVLHYWAATPDHSLQRLPMVACRFVHSGVAQPSQLVEHVSSLTGKDAFERQPPQELLEGFQLTAIAAVVSSDQLGQKLGELPDLEQRSRWVVAEIALSLSPQQRQLRLLLRQKAKIRRRDHSPTKMHGSTCRVLAMFTGNATSRRMQSATGVSLTDIEGRCMIDAEILARRAIEDAGYRVHDANVIFGVNCPNIDLVVNGQRQAVYVQVKGTTRAAGRDAIIVDGSPWTEDQLHGRAPIFNKRAGFLASLVVLADLSNPTSPEFYVATPDHLTKLARQRGRKLAALPKRDGSRRSIQFRKELFKETLKTSRNAWHLFGPPAPKERISTSSLPRAV